MSQTQVLATLLACLEDSAVGLVAQARKLAPFTPIGAGSIRMDVRFVAWKLSGVMQSSTTPNVMLRPGRWSANLKQGNSRDASVLVEVGMEFFDADADVLQANITIYATALAASLDALRDYSDINGGTVIDIIDPIDVVFGQFDGPTSSGFLATIQLEERSRQ